MIDQKLCQSPDQGPDLGYLGRLLSTSIRVQLCRRVTLTLLHESPREVQLERVTLMSCCNLICARKLPSKICRPMSLSLAMPLQKPRRPVHEIWSSNLRSMSNIRGQEIKASKSSIPWDNRRVCHKQMKYFMRMTGHRKLQMPRNRKKEGLISMSLGSESHQRTIFSVTNKAESSLQMWLRLRSKNKYPTLQVKTEAPKSKSSIK